MEVTEERLQGIVFNFSCLMSPHFYFYLQAITMWTGGGRGEEARQTNHVSKRFMACL